MNTKTLVFFTMLIAFFTLGMGSALAERLTRADCNEIVDNAVAGALAETSDFRPKPDDPQMHIYCMDHTGRILAFVNMDDAWVGSIDIAKAKAYTAMAFSTNENALTSRDIGLASQPGGPLWQIGSSNRPGTRGREGITEHGIIEFPGGIPLYKNNERVGGIGVSGDSVRKDEAVAVCGSKGFEPPEEIRSDIVPGLGLPYTEEPCPI